MTIYEFVREGGPLMIPIIGLSVVTLALVLERATYWLRLWWVRDDRLRTRLRCLDLNEERLDGSSDPVCRVLARYVRRPDDPQTAVVAARRLVDDSRSGIPILNFAAQTGTAFGLFGTVVGVSISFKGMAAASARELTYGLAVALNTTICGLIVFLFASLALTLLRGATRRLQRHLEDGLNDIRRRMVRGGTGGETG